MLMGDEGGRQRFGGADAIGAAAAAPTAGHVKQALRLAGIHENTGRAFRAQEVA